MKFRVTISKIIDAEAGERIGLGEIADETPETFAYWSVEILRRDCLDDVLDGAEWQVEIIDEANRLEELQRTQQSDRHTAINAGLERLERLTGEDFHIEHTRGRNE